MKYIKEFNSSFIDKLNIEDVIKGTHKVNSDGSIDVYGDVDLKNLYLTSIPYNFNEVSGTFDCSDNKITSLKGSPKKVGRHFRCSYNNLTSLEFISTEIGGDLYVTKNKLYDMYHINIVGGDILYILNPIDEIFDLLEVRELFGDISITKELVKYMNEFRPIRGKWHGGKNYDKNVLLCKRLEECFYMCDVEIDLSKETFKNYILLE